MSLQHRSTVFTPPIHHLLPNEIMALIFSSVTDSQSTLYQCTLVNRSFYKALNPVLWHSPQLTHKDMISRFVKAILGMSVQRRQLIYGLRLNFKYLQNSLYRAQDYPTMFDKITLSQSQFQVPSDLTLVLGYMPNLKRLKLSHCFADNTVRLLPLHPQLTCLKLYKTLITKDVFDALAQCRLEDFEWTLDVTPSSALLFRAATFPFHCLAACPLRRLAIHYISKRPTIVRLNLQMQISIAELMLNPSVFPQLTILELSHCPNIDDQILTVFFNHHPLLKQLHLAHQNAVTDTTLDAMTLPFLKRLSLTYMEHITTAAVHRLITTCPLTHLDVSHSLNVNTAGFPASIVKR